MPCTPLIACSNGVVTADSSGEIGGGIPFSVFHGRTRRIGCSSTVSGPALQAYLESDGLKLLERIHEGHEIHWDGNNHVGTLTDDAQEAEAELENALQEIEQANVCEVENYLEHCTLEEIWLPQKSLAEIVEAIEADAKANHTVLEGDVGKYIIELVESLLYRNKVVPTAILDELAIPYCQSGHVTGVRCESETPNTNLIQLDYMPEHLRDSHRMAGNWGTYPQNGAIRIHVCSDCLEALSTDLE